MCCSSTQEDSLPSACLRGLTRHLKTEPTETVALCLDTRRHRAFEPKASCSLDEQHKSYQIKTIVWVTAQMWHNFVLFSPVSGGSGLVRISLEKNKIQHPVG
jgi:hypothetical protein